MQYVTLGRTGLKISRLGFGGIPIQRVSAAEAGPLLDAVLSAGINYIDTARGYTSLANLRTDHIDLYQVHNPTVAQLEQVCAPGGALEALREAKAALGM